MRTKKCKFSNPEILLVLPVFMLYTNHSLLIYHSHIPSNGTIITHAHSLNDCESKQFPADNSHPAKKQIIVFQGLMLGLNDYSVSAYSIEDGSDFFVKIRLPLIDIKTYRIFQT